MCDVRHGSTPQFFFGRNNSDSDPPQWPTVASVG